MFAGNPARGTGEEMMRLSHELNYQAPILLASEAAGQMKSRGTQGAIVLFSTMQVVAPRAFSQANLPRMGRSDNRRASIHIVQRGCRAGNSVFSRPLRGPHHGPRLDPRLAVATYRKHLAGGHSSWRIELIGGQHAFKYMKDSDTPDKDIVVLCVGSLALLVSGVLLPWRGVESRRHATASAVITH